MSNDNHYSKKTKMQWIDDKAKDFVNDKLLKTFIMTLLGIVGLTANNEYQSLKEGNPLNYWNMTFIIFLCIIIYAGYQVAYRNLNKLNIAKNIGIYQDGVQKSIFDIADYMIHTMLPNAEDTNDKLKIIRSIPDIFGLVPVEVIQKTSASGFQLISETLASAELRALENAKKMYTSFENSINKSTEVLKELLVGKVGDTVIDPLLPKELQNVPVPSTNELEELD